MVSWLFRWGECQTLEIRWRKEIVMTREPSTGVHRRHLKKLACGLIAGALTASLIVVPTVQADENQPIAPTRTKPITLDGKELWVYSDMVLSNHSGMSAWGLQVCGNLEPDACVPRVKVLVSNPDVVSQEFVKEEGDEVATVFFTAEQPGQTLVCLKGFGKQSHWTCKTLIVLPTRVTESRTGYGLTVPQVRVPVGMSVQFYDDMRARSNRAKMKTSNAKVLPEGQVSNFFTFHAKQPGQSRLCISYPKNANARFFRSNCQTITVIR
jgi:hypothetical protein